MHSTSNRNRWRSWLMAGYGALRQLLNPRRRRLSTAMAADTRQKILSVAEELFARQGFGGTTVADIADRVGVRAPAIYRHFRNKQEIYEAVLDELFAPFNAMVEELARHDIKQVPVEEFLAPIVTRYIERPTIAPIILQSTLAGGEQLTQLTERWFIPFFNKVMALLPRDSALGTPEAVINFHSLMLGYLSLAPFHRQIFGLDPLAPDNLATHLALQALLSETLKTQPN